MPDRTVETLRITIERGSLPGSHVILDEWASYANVVKWNDIIYTQEVVVHQANFFNPNNPGVHTQSYENLRIRPKKNFVHKVAQMEDCLQVICMSVRRNSVGNKVLIFNEFLKLVMSTYRV